MTLSDLSAGKQKRFTFPSIAQAKSVRQIPQDAVSAANPTG